MCVSHKNQVRSYEAVGDKFQYKYSMGKKLSMVIPPKFTVHPHTVHSVTSCILASSEGGTKG